MIRSMVIGLGQMGLLYDFDDKRHKPSSHTSAYMANKQFDYVAASDIVSDREELLHRIAPNTTFYGNFDSMLMNHKVDVISICTPPQHHLSIIEQILTTTNTRLIFCEKPVVQNIKEAGLLVELLANKDCLIIPNLSRRWNKGMQRVVDHIKKNIYGPLYRINCKYTRGIFNTGSHIFDLINWFAGKIENVMVIEQVLSSADSEGDASFSFHFETQQGINGYVEAFNDKFYYMFEIDLYFENGKIEITESGNKVHYYHSDEHPLFSGFVSLQLNEFEDHVLQDSNIQNAIDHIENVLNDEEAPICTLMDGLLPIFIADAIKRSNRSGKWETVQTIW